MADGQAADLADLAEENNMVIQLKYGSGLGKGISALGASIGEALQARAKKQRMQEIMKPYQPPLEGDDASAEPAENIGEQNGSILSGIVGEPTEDGDQSLQQAQPPAQPQAADQAYKNKMAEIQYKKQQVAALQAEGHTQEAQIMQRDVLQQENLLQQERLQDKTLKEKVSAAKDQRAFASNTEYLKSIEKTSGGINKREATLNSMASVLAKGDLQTVRNFAADYLGNKGYTVDAIRSSSANDLNAAVKHELISDMQELPGGTRLNQYMERMLKESLQSPLKSPENNLRITETQRYLLNNDKKKIEITNRIVNQHEKAGREPPAHLALKVSEELKPFAQEGLKKLTKLYKDIDSGKVKAKSMLNLEIAKDRIKEKPPKEGNIWMAFGDDATPKQVPVRDSAVWQKRGGTLIR